MREGRCVLLKIVKNLRLLPALIRPIGPPSPVEKALGVCGFAVDFRKNQCKLPSGAEPRPYQLRLSFMGFRVK